MDDTRSLLHTKWNCKYHIVYAPNLIGKEANGKLREDIGHILRELCNWMQVAIVFERCPAYEIFKFKT